MTNYLMKTPGGGDLYNFYTRNFNPNACSFLNCKKEPIRYFAEVKGPVASCKEHMTFYMNCDELTLEEAIVLHVLQS